MDMDMNMKWNKALPIDQQFQFVFRIIAIVVWLRMRWPRYELCTPKLFIASLEISTKKEKKKRTKFK